MANSTSHSALPYPIKGARFTIGVPYLDADGDPTDPTTPDTEFSLDAGAYGDCAEEMTTISGSNGSGYITLTGAETNGSLLYVTAKVASGPKATIATLYPRVLAEVGTGTLSAGSAGGGTLGTLLAYDVTGCFIKTTGGTGGGGTGGASNQARKIVTYNTSTGAFTVAPNWETTPDNTTTYAVLLPEGVTLGMLWTLNPATAGRTLVVDAAGLADANTVKVGPSGSGTVQTAGDLLSKLLKYFQLALRKDAAIATDNATEVTAINASGGSGAGAFANTTDSLEAIKDNGAGSSSDPLANNVPGSYAAGTAGAVLGTIGTGQFVVLTSIVGRTLNLVRGDAYNNSNGTAIPVTKATGETWPTDLTGYTLAFGADIETDKTVGGATTPTTISGTATATVMTGSGQAFRLEFTSTQLASIAEGNGAYNWSVTATSGSIRRTLASGPINVVLSPATTP